MKRLTAIRLINWHYFSDQTLNLRGSGLFTGETGAGKSTVLDAIQFCLVGDSRRVRFNISANEQSERTLTTYLRGKTGEEKGGGKVGFLRDGNFTSYIVLEFLDTRKSRFFLVGCAIDSYSTGDHDAPVFFKLENHNLRDDLLLDGRRPLSAHREFRHRIQSLRGELYATADQYRQALLSRFGFLRPQFFNLLVKGMFFRPMQDFYRFVCDYLLDANPVDMAVMRENLQHYRYFEQMAHDAEEKVEALEKIRKLDGDRAAVEDWIATQSYVIQRARTEHAAEQLLSLKHQFEKSTASANDSRKRLLVAEETRQGRQAELDSVIVELAQDDGSRRQRELQTSLLELSRQKESLEESVEPLQKGAAVELAHLESATSSIQAEADHFGIGDDGHEDLEVIGAARTLFSALVHSHWEVPVPKEGLLRSASSSERIGEMVASRYHALRQRVPALKEEAQQLNSDLRALGQGRMRYPEFVIDLQRLIREDTGADAKPLCELISIPNEKWQNAVEGYLNTQRFDLFVEPQHFSEALATYERRKREFRLHSVGLVNCYAVVRDHRNPEPDSLALEVRTDNPYAQAYIDRLMGNVVKCETEQVLKRFRVSITHTCMTYRNHAARQIHPDVYSVWYVGERAFTRQREQKQIRLREIASQVTKIQADTERTENVYRMLKDKAAAYRHLAAEWERIRSIPSIVEQIIELNEELSSLDLSRADSLREQDKILRNQIRELESEANERREEASRFEERAANYRIQIDSVTESHRLLQTELDAWGAGNPLPAEFGAARYEEERRQGKDNLTIASNFESNQHGNRTRADNLRVSIVDSRRQYNERYQFGADPNCLENGDYDRELEKLRDSDLPSYMDRISDAEEKAEEEFKTHFIYRLREQIEETRKHFRDLNEVLHGITFGHDQYQFICAPSSSYREFYDMLSDPLALEGGGLFDGPFRDKYQSTLDRIFEAMTDETSDLPVNIQALTDYRTYLDFDLRIKHDSGGETLFSKVLREKSGGETQTPFYVALASAFLQVYRPGNVDSVRLMILDEAFAKMDEDRIENTLLLIRQLGLQLMVAAPITQAQAIVPQVETSLVLLREGHHAFVMDYHQVFQPTESLEVSELKPNRNAADRSSPISLPLGTTGPDDRPDGTAT